MQPVQSIYIYTYIVPLKPTLNIMIWVPAFMTTHVPSTPNLLWSIAIAFNLQQVRWSRQITSWRYRDANQPTPPTKVPLSERRIR